MAANRAPAKRSKRVPDKSERAKRLRARRALTDPPLDLHEIVHRELSKAEKAVHDALRRESGTTDSANQLRTFCYTQWRDSLRRVARALPPK